MMKISRVGDSPGGTWVAFPRSRRIRCVRAASGGQGRPLCRPPLGGRLDRRWRRARLRCIGSAALRISAAKRPVTCGRFGDLRFLPPRLCRRERADGGYRDACSIARSLRGLLDACSIPRRGQPDPIDRARDRPALPADPALPVEHGALRRRRRPVRPPAGCEVKASCYACAPSYHAGAAASFANRTAMQIAVSRQSGGAGSGGTTDKAGAEL